MAYLLDANVFIEAKNRHYGFDFCPAFWDWLQANNENGRVYSVERVGHEIAVVHDELSNWIATLEGGFFLRPTSQVLRALVQVGNWALSEDYKLPAITGFLDGADCYLVAQALAEGHEVVTHEVPTNGRKKIKIPNACIGLGVKCLTPFEMLRRENARFVLGVTS